MGISISTTPAKFDIEHIPYKFSMQNTNAKLQIRQKPPLINIDTEPIQILIDQYPCFAEEGHKNNMDFAVDNKQRGYESVMKYIGKVAEDGDSMAKIGHNASIMIDIARRDSVTTHEFGMGTVPMSRPRIDIKGGNVKLDPAFRNNIGEINGVTAEYIPGGVTYDFTPGKINLRMLSYGSVNISYSGNNIDTYL